MHAPHSSTSSLPQTEIVDLTLSKIKTKPSCELIAKTRGLLCVSNPYIHCSLAAGVFLMYRFAKRTAGFAYAVPFGCNVLSFISPYNQLLLVFLDCT